MKSEQQSPHLNQEQAMRYSRQIMLPGFDLEGQEKLLASRILLIGAGGLGCAAAQYLAAAGIGHITIVDDDKVELSNLQRQVLHSEATLGVNKSKSAQAALKRLNPLLSVDTFVKRMDDAKLSEQINLHDLVLDCCDNLETRQQLNQLCFTAKVPLVSGAAIRMEGQVCSFTQRAEHACYQCLSASFGEQNLSCMEAGIMSPVVGIIGAMQALEGIKILSGFGEALTNKLLMFDAMTSEWRRFTLMKHPRCAVCAAT
ncbi:molybdopterin-synthase adenylyltransferase MoeB [Flavobacterium sp. W21_SRS_FM6]|uniref:molybdopterin-synthase adenylyltransferase MoeB n=1 Tax=Flavobacterium sp. W21_SRS_FM6 TaxID=3240268 RepID=UPI003F92328C